MLSVLKFLCSFFRNNRSLLPVKSQHPSRTGTSDAVKISSQDFKHCCSYCFYFTFVFKNFKNVVVFYGTSWSRTVFENLVFAERVKKLLILYGSCIVYESLPELLILSQINLAQNLTPCLFKIHLAIIFQIVLSLQVFPKFLCAFFISRMCGTFLLLFYFSYFCTKILDAKH